MNLESPLWRRCYLHLRWYFWIGWGCGFMATADGRMDGIFHRGVGGGWVLAQSGKDLANLVVTHHWLRTAGGGSNIFAACNTIVYSAFIPAATSERGYFENRFVWSFLINSAETFPGPALWKIQIDLLILERRRGEYFNWTAVGRQEEENGCYLSEYN